MVAQRLIAAGAVVACLGLGFVGCTAVPPDPDTRIADQPGLQCRDLREMTARMAPKLLQIPEIVQNPTTVVVVMKSIENKTESEPGRNFDIYVASLKSLLNDGRCRDRMTFVEDLATLRHVQGEELPGEPDMRLKPQFALWGTFYSKFDKKTTYYLCTFRMTDLRTGRQVWEGSYDVLTLNVPN